MHIQSQSLATHRVQIGQLLQFVVAEVEVLAEPGGDDLLAQFLLHLGMLREKLEKSRHRVRGRIHAGVDQGPEERKRVSVGRVGHRSDVRSARQHSRHLRDELVVG